jgi:protein phosphatase
VREINEDAYLAEPPIFAVADGLGGHQAGEIASKLALKIIKNHLKKKLNETKVLKKKLLEAVKKANQAVYQASKKESRFEGMGTTLTLSYYLKPKIFIAHVGDSRAYLFRKGKIFQLTEDHSVVHELVKRGEILEEEALNHPLRSALTQAIGTNSQVHVDLLSLSLKPNDRLLLTTDGLTCHLSEKEISEIVLEKEINKATGILVEKAKEKGGYDNITVVLVDFEKEDVA